MKTETQMAKELHVEAIVIANGVEVEGHQLVSQKFLQVVNHILSEVALMDEAFSIDSECIRKIRFLTNFDGLGEEYANKYGFFNTTTKEVGITLQGNFDTSKRALKDGDNAELLSLRGHLWFQMLGTIFHEFTHAALFAVDPEHYNEGKEDIEEFVTVEAMDEMAAFVMTYDSEPVAWANEPFFGPLFMHFMINEIKDNTEAWALAQYDIHQYNARNNTRVIWKDGETGCHTFRHWFKVSYGHTDWDESIQDLVELKFSLSVPTTVAIEAPAVIPVETAVDTITLDATFVHEDAVIQPSDEVVGALHDALKDAVIEDAAPINEWVDELALRAKMEAAGTTVDDSPFKEGDAGAADREALVGGAMAAKDESDEAHLSAQYEWTEPADIAEDNKAVEGTVDEDYALTPDPDGEVPFLTEEELVLDPDAEYTPDELAFMGSEDIEESGDDEYGDGESHLYDEEVLPEFPSPSPASIAEARNAVAATAPKTEHYTGHGTGKYAGLETKPPAFVPTSDFTPPHEPVPLPTSELTPTQAMVPLPEPAPAAPVAPPAASTQEISWPAEIPLPQAPAPQGSYVQALRTDLPNHNFTAEQMKTMSEQVFMRCMNHIFTKCGWVPSGNPSFMAELRGAIMEPISMSGIEGIDKYLVGMDISDPATGQYVVNSPATAHGGMIKGKVTSKEGLPSYTLYFNYNGIEIKRFIAPQNQWKLNKPNTDYTAPAKQAQHGAQIMWIMDGADNSGKKWRGKIENGVFQWFV